MTSNDPNDLPNDADTPDGRELTSSNQEIERQRVARLIGQILARHWLRNRTIQETGGFDASDQTRPDDGACSG